MANLVLASVAVGSLFTVPDSDWTAIDQRVGYAIKLSNIADQVTQYLPGFSALVTACRTWRDSTFPGINTAAASLNSYSREAVTEFTELQAKLGPGNDLSPQLRELVITTLRQLADQTAPLNDQFRLLAGQIADFTDLNRAVDAQVDAFVNKLGPQWKSILPSTRKVDDATGLVRGTWEALSSDLNALVSEPIDVTEPFVLSLQIDSALLAWTNLQAEAAAFGKLAADQEQYLSGAWLG
ncbi:MAG: hypothetical protein ABI140_00465 [Jatrophihabitantaceae bacterium]